MGDQYGLPDLRHLLAGRTHFPTFTQPQEQQFATQPHYDLLMLGSQVLTGSGVVDVAGFSDSTTTTTTNNSTSITTTNPPLTTTAAATLCGFEMDGCIGVDGGNGRWPRQETLTLLQIRSQLDSKFKEANQKGPLWDEVSRILAEEHGYQRTGKKCREKFENLYKYYKKTKEGKAGRQDGKHYRFFRQLEALYGEASNPVSVSEPHFVGNSLGLHTTSNNATTYSDQETLQGQKLGENLSISTSSCFDSSSSEDGDNDLTVGDFMDNSSMDNKKTVVMKDAQSSRSRRRSWKAKIRDFVDSQMRKLMETQEAWLEKMLKSIEQKEHERMTREEEWRKREAARIDQEHKFWAKERAWFEARDAALMDTLKKITGKELKDSSPEQLMGSDLHENIENNGSETFESTVNSTDKWLESEVSSLIHLRTSMESRFQQHEYSKETLWMEISARMTCLGYDQSPKSCEEKWEDINKYIRRSNELSKKRKENSETIPQNQYLESAYYQGGAFYGHGICSNSEGPSPSINSNAGTAMSASCFRFMMAEGENLWENYGAKINLPENQ